jgi:phosphatidylinositol glycan class N
MQAHLAGLNFPVNSVGELPLDYLSCGLQAKSEVAIANALEIAEQYHVKERLSSKVIDFRLQNGYRNSFQTFCAPEIRG